MAKIPRQPVSRVRRGAMGWRDPGMVGLPLARMALNPQEREDEDQQDNGQLRRPAKVSFAQPGCVDAKRQRVDAKEADRRNVVQAFHQGEADANHDGRPCLRQGHGKKGPPRRFAKGARHIKLAHGLAQEARLRRHVDIGVENQRQHDDRAGKRADFRKHIVLRAAPSHGAAQPGLQRPRIIQEIHIGVGRRCRWAWPAA